MAGKPILVDCPKCGRKCEYSATNRWRPFCSERCKTIDLGAWANDEYRIGGDPLESPTEDEPGVTPQ